MELMTSPWSAYLTTIPSRCREEWRYSSAQRGTNPRRQDSGTTKPFMKAINICPPSPRPSVLLTGFYTDWSVAALRCVR